MTVQHSFTALDAAIRLDRFLAEQLRAAGFSREKLKRLIRDGKCLVNGTVEYSPKATLALGDQVSIQAESPPAALNAEAGDLDILYRDAVLAVVNKPAGLTVHPAPGRPTGTLAHRLLSHFPELETLEGFRPGIVHRLDKDTSGLMLVALTEQCRLALAGQFARHEVYKEYLGLVRGIPARDEEIIEAPIGRHPSVKTKMAVAPDGKAAKSARQTLFAGPCGRFSLQAVRIFSGRTHQVRVHMQHIGHPLLGDSLYGGGDFGLCRAERQMLHAWKLGFEHPLPQTAGPLQQDAEAPPQNAEALQGGRQDTEQAVGRLAFRCPPPQDFTDTLRACLSQSLAVVITGLPGCGKSLLLQFFQERGFPVFSADAEVARLYQPGGDGATLLRARFGERFVPDSSGPVDKTALGAAMRESDALRREVESLLHPLVRHAVTRFWQQHEDSATLSIAEIPLYLEAGYKEQAAKDTAPSLRLGLPLLVGVSCPFSLRKDRLERGRGWNEAVIAGMEAWQWPEDAKMRSCDLIVDNSEDLDAFGRNAEALFAALLEIRRERHEAAVRQVQALW